MALEPGAWLGSYRIVSALAAGAMGEVYRAGDSKLGRDVAIKVLPGELAQNAERLSRFEREARILASLNHPNVATVHGFDVAPGTPGAEPIAFLVMELIDGETLADRIGRGPMPLAEALPLFVQIAEGLDAAHGRGVIHRDLKPANVKITRTGRVKILDFGLAKALPRGAPDSEQTQGATQAYAETVAGTLLGTPAYMSPQQARGMEVDRSADIWAFGCMLYEALSGRRVFGGATAADTLASVLGREPAWDALPPGTPSALRRLLRFCLAKDPADRLRDIGDARLELQAVSAGEPDAAPAEPPAVARTGVGYRIALAVIALAAGIVVGWVLSGRFRHPAPAPSAAPARFEIPVPASERLRNRERLLALSADGRLLAFQTLVDPRLFLRSLDRLESAPVAGTERGRNPFFSPDGRWLAFWRDGQIYKVAVAGGSPIALCPARLLYGASWTADGRILFGQAHAGIFQVPADGGQPELLVAPDATRGEVAFDGPQLLPDGRSLLFSLLERGQNWDGASVVMHRLDTGERRTLVDGGTNARYLSTGHLVFARRGTLYALALDLEQAADRDSPVPVLDGMWRSFLFETGAHHFDVSDGGTLVYVPAPPPLRRILVWIDRNGVEEPLAVPERFYQHPRLSPDGRRIVVDTIDEQDLWVYDVARGTMARLTTEQTHIHPVWSADGGRIFFDSNLGMALDWKAVDSSGPAEQLLSDDARHLTAVSVSPDGARLAIELSEDFAGFDIAMIRFDRGGALEPWLATPQFRESSPMFSPDGQWLAYVSDETGRDEVYVQSVSGSGPRWLISKEGGREPLWSPAGDELFFRQGPLRSPMMAVPVRIGPDFEAGEPRQLFAGIYGMEPIGAHPSYDVSRDGRRFLMTKNVTPLREIENPRTFRVVLDWFAELERLAPTG
jgi:eukaryotic-like serine/threonine-protein kinase